ncbi:MAG: glutamine amidotransferase [Beijerinckiaceae bacterium]
MKPVLIILHQEHSTPGRVGRLLLEKGVPLDMRRPRFGDPLPSTMAEHSGAIIFGGPMSANDPEDWIAQETAWIDVALRENAPFLGICLGAQMLARQLGGSVWFHRKNKIEAGYYPIAITDAGVALEKTIGAPWPRTVYQWHREGFTCPTGCTLLATGDAFAEQAFRYGHNAWGIQFHPEVTYAMINRWTTRAWERLEMAHARPREAHLADWFTYDAAVAQWINAFLDHWLGLNKPVASPPADLRLSRALLTA